jgi:hypothetical protein
MDSTKALCDICKKETHSLYFDMKHNVAGHKNCIKGYSPDYRITGKSYSTATIDDIYSQRLHCDMCQAETRCTCISRELLCQIKQAQLTTSPLIEYPITLISNRIFIIAVPMV